MKMLMILENDQKVERPKQPSIIQRVENTLREFNIITKDMQFEGGDNDNFNHKKPNKKNDDQDESQYIPLINQYNEEAK